MDENGTGKSSKMIDIQDLRIGNLINDSAEIVEIRRGTIMVWPVGLHGITSYRLNQVKGIPLTPEWLERFGFELDHMGKRPYRIEIPEVCTLSATQNGFSDTGAWWLSMKSEYYSQPVTIIAHYVHELQNLYRVIAGKELELKTTE